MTPYKRSDGTILGYTKQLDSGDIMVYDGYGMVVGRYSKNIDKTVDATGWPVANGNVIPILWNK